MTVIEFGWVASLEVALDVGHSSIGWAVFRSEPFEPQSTGVVIFGSEDCLAKKRRDYRRQRRHIRSTRQRIERMKRWFDHIGFLSRRELDQPGTACPWLKAAQVLNSRGGVILSAKDLWDVLRWYAHNRGYDGNRAWARDETEAEEDTAREQAALDWMREHNTQTMAETVCAVLKVGPRKRADGGDKNSSNLRFKGRGVAFPRRLVTDEVRRILQVHVNELPGLDSRTIRILMDDARDGDATAAAGICLPKRYEGGLLFGQLIPRFDNRIISSCPVTYEREYALALDEGKSEDEAKHRASRQAKVPAKKCREFLLFRWAMILANVQVADGSGTRPLSVNERLSLHELMVRSGRLTKHEFLKALDAIVGSPRHNGSALLMPPDADQALILRPEKEALKRLSGRAPHTRAVMKQAARDVFAGRHPMAEGGALFRSEELRALQLRRTVEEKTNNHLVRHRLLILRRLVKDLLAAYAGNDPSRISQITIEVNPDLRSFSGMTAKEKEQELGQRLDDFKKVVQKLRGDLPEGTAISAGLIRKARIAQDMGWTCPYTGMEYDALDLLHGHVDKDHIIPRSLRPSDSLDSLVLTSRVINEMKGQRTAAQFIKEFGGRRVEDGKMRVLEILPWNQFQKRVESLDIRGIHDQDRARKKRRKALLLQEHYTEKEFVPKDLTQTSHLVRLAAEELKKEFGGIRCSTRIVSMPGSVTAETRKAWKLEACLAQANPEAAELLKRRKTEPAPVSIKQELRDITHLHHALDACVLACAAHYLEKKGNLWKALVQRRKSEAENLELLSTGLFKRGQDGQARLQDLPAQLKNQISRAPAECRVVQHIPSNRRGMKAEETVWRVLDPEDRHPSAQKLRKWAELANIELPGTDSGKVLLVKRTRKSAPGAKAPKNLLHQGSEFWWAYEVVALSKLVGPGAEGRLKKIKAAKQLDENYGVILGPEPKVIPYLKVQQSLDASSSKTVLRKGHIIFVKEGTYKGLWKIFSIQAASAGIRLDLAKPDRPKRESKGYGIKREVLLRTLMRNGLVIASRSLIGFDQTGASE